MLLYQGQEITLNAFKSKIFPSKSTQRKGLKILTLKQMFRRWPIALAQTEAGNISENLLNDLRQIVHYLHQAKEITKKVYKNIMNFCFYINIATKSNKT